MQFIQISVNYSATLKAAFCVRMIFLKQSIFWKFDNLKSIGDHKNSFEGLYLRNAHWTLWICNFKWIVKNEMVHPHYLPNKKYRVIFMTMFCHSCRFVGIICIYCLAIKCVHNKFTWFHMIRGWIINSSNIKTFCVLFIFILVSYVSVELHPFVIM